MPTSSPPVAPDSGWKSFPKSEIPKMFNEGHIYHHLVESLQGTGEGSDLDECDNIDLDSNTSKPTLAFFAVHARLWERQECYSLHVFTMTITRIAAAYAIATVLRRNHFLTTVHYFSNGSNYGDSDSARLFYGVRLLSG